MDKSRITDGGTRSTWTILLIIWSFFKGHNNIVLLTVRERHCESVGEDVFHDEERERRGSPQKPSILDLFSYHSLSIFASLWKLNRSDAHSGWLFELLSLKSVHRNQTGWKDNWYGTRLVGRYLTTSSRSVLSNHSNKSLGWSRCRIR